MAHSDAAVAGSPPRELWVDNLRVAVIAGVIVVHTSTAYVVDVSWYYDDEHATVEPWSTLLSVPALLGAVFALGPLFLLAGWFAARSLARRGPEGFFRARLLRLGVPLATFVLVVNPLADYVGNLRDEHQSLWYYLGTSEVSVMWFVAALLVFCAAYAVLRRLRPVPAARRPLRTGVVVAAVATVALGSWAVWQVWPWAGETFLNTRVGEWPQGAVLFALGAHAGEAGWLADVTVVRARRLGQVALVGATAFLVLLLVKGAQDDVEGLLESSGGWPVALFAALDGLVAVTWALWFVSWVRRRWPRHGTLLGRASRASYATYVLHPLVLTTGMVLCAPVALPPVVKVVVIAAAGVPLCFAVGYAATRLPGVSRVL